MKSYRELKNNGRNKIEHPLHQAIAKCLEDKLSSCEIIIGEDCGGNQKIPLYCTEEKSHETQYCQVDILILENNQIRVIIEIEESDIIPTQICGKFLTTALSSYYIHECKNNIAIEMSHSTLFIQILDNSKLSDRTSKIDQGEQIEKSIKNILPVKGSKIKKYRLFYGNKSDFEEGNKCRELIDCIKKSLNPLRFG